MALNKQAFKTRALTAVVFAAVMLVGLLWNFWSFFVLLSIIHFGLWSEYLKLAEKIFNTKIDPLIRSFFAVCGYVLFLVLGLTRVSYDFGWSPFGAFISFNFLLWIVLFIGLLAVTFQNKQVPLRAKWFMLLGFVYLTMPLTMLLNIREFPLTSINGDEWMDSGKIFTCAVIFSIWINDTMAYLVGSMIGKTPFSKISPNKTWEGTAGGAVLCVVVISLLGSLIPAAKPIALQHWIAIAAICAFFGTSGDLLESKIKRLAGVKDSGNFMPGHGGFLDRFDSMLIATPFVWLYLKLFL